MSALTVTIHENDRYTVDEDLQAIGISDQFKALYGEDVTKHAEKDLKEFLLKLLANRVNIRYSKEPA